MSIGTAVVSFPSTPPDPSPVEPGTVKASPSKPPDPSPVELGAVKSPPSTPPDPLPVSPGICANNIKLEHRQKASIKFL